MTYRELQIECKRRGLLANGNRELLEARLNIVVNRPPQFTFIGDPREGTTNPEFVTFCGVTFYLNGLAVTVDNPEAAAKLAANSHFK